LQENFRTLREFRGKISHTYYVGKELCYLEESLLEHSKVRFCVVMGGDESLVESGGYQQL